MEKYKIKKEALPFFDKKFSTDIEILSYWKLAHVPEMALEKVDKVFITYGHNEDGVNHLQGWCSSEQNAHFRFTINLGDMSHDDYKSIKEKEFVSDIMREMQTVLNRNIDHYLSKNAKS